MPTPRLVHVLIALVATLLVQCERPAAAPPAARLVFDGIPEALAESFSGEKAHAHVAEIVSFGPRPPQSEGFERTLVYLEKTLAGFGWTTHRQGFRAATPAGPIDFTNLIARHPSAPALPASVPVVIGGHIDSKQLSFPFVGANDGGSSTGIMLELARVLATDPAAAAKVELVFFDGEEGFKPNITPNDGLFGSKHYAGSLAERSEQPALGIVLDIVGDPNFPLYYNPDTPETFATAVEKISPDLAFGRGLKRAPGPVIDDHVPLQDTGLPCLHVIGDFTAMDYWHQRGDTLDKVDPGMLGRVGRLTLRFLSEIKLPADD